MCFQHDCTEVLLALLNARQNHEIRRRSTHSLTTIQKKAVYVAICLLPLSVKPADTWRMLKRDEYTGKYMRGERKNLVRRHKCGNISPQTPCLSAGYGRGRRWRQDTQSTSCGMQ